MVRMLLSGLVEGGGREAGFSTAAASAPPSVEMTILWLGVEIGLVAIGSVARGLVAMGSGC